MQNRKHIEENDDQPKKSCWSIFCSTLSMLSPKKLFIFYLLATANALNAENSNNEKTEKTIYFRYGQQRFFRAPLSEVEIKPAPDCTLKIEGYDLDGRKLPTDPFIIRQECQPARPNFRFKLDVVEAELTSDIFEGHSFTNGKLHRNRKYTDCVNHKEETVKSETDFTKGLDVIERRTTTSLSVPSCK